MRSILLLMAVLTITLGCNRSVPVYVPIAEQDPLLASEQVEAIRAALGSPSIASQLAAMKSLEKFPQLREHLAARLEELTTARDPRVQTAAKRLLAQ